MKVKNIRPSRDKAEELAATAGRLEREITNLGSTDHPKWLQRRVDILERRAEKRRKGREQKLRER